MTHDDMYQALERSRADQSRQLQIVIDQMNRGFDEVKRTIGDARVEQREELRRANMAWQDGHTRLREGIDALIDIRGDVEILKASQGKVSLKALAQIVGLSVSASGVFLILAFWAMQHLKVTP